MPLGPGLLPPFPTIFSGAVTVGGQPVADGLALYAQVGYWRSEPVITAGGRYQGLKVSANNDWALHLKPIAFFLDGVQAEQTAIFNGQSMEITVVLDLTFALPPPQ